MFDTKNKAFRRDVSNAIANRKYEMAPEGVYIPSIRALGSGVYVDSINGVEVGQTPNLIVDQGFVDILNTVFGTTSKKAGFFVALFSGAVTPAANWVAATFAATASEITSNTEGYTQAARPAWVTPNATTPQIDNYAAKAQFTIATAGTLNVNGAAVLSDQGKGSTGGVLYSAARYPNTRQLQAADNYEVGYRLSFSAL
jgi:hypothetical protein